MLYEVITPREPLFIDGKRLRDVIFWVPHPAKLGLGLSILSYAGKVIVGVRVDEAVTKNPRRLVELFEEEASSMLEGDNNPRPQDSSLDGRLAFYVNGKVREA